MPAYLRQRGQKVMREFQEWAVVAQIERAQKQGSVSPRRFPENSYFENSRSASPRPQHVRLQLGLGETRVLRLNAHRPVALEDTRVNGKIWNKIVIAQNQIEKVQRQHRDEREAQQQVARSLERQLREKVDRLEQRQRPVNKHEYFDFEADRTNKLLEQKRMREILIAHHNNHYYHFEDPKSPQSPDESALSGQQQP